MSNSIAFMGEASKKVEPKFTDVIERAVTALYPSQFKTLVQLADQWDGSASELHQWRIGHRPIPWKRAQAVAGVLGVAPESISEEFGEILATVGAVSSPHKAAPTVFQRVSQSARPDQEILFEAVQIVLVDAAAERRGVTAKRLMDAYEIALARALEADPPPSPPTHIGDHLHGTHQGTSEGTSAVAERKVRKRTDGTT